MDPGLERLEAIRGFASASGWPVLADPASQLRGLATNDETPILDLGDALTRSPGFAARMRPEVVLRIGEPPVSKAQRLWIESAAPEQIWWLDEGGSWGEPSHRATRVVRGGATSLLASATRELVEHRGRESDWCRAFEDHNAIARKAMEDVVFGEGIWSGLSLAASLARQLSEQSVLFASNSMAIRLLDLAFMHRPDPFRVLCSRGASGIDGINSTALGVAAAAGRPTILFTGDLAFLHDLSGFLLTRRERLPLTIVVLDDNGGGIFSMLPLAAQRDRFDFDRLFHTPHDLDLERVAALFEMDYEAVASVATFEAALDRAIARPGVSVVHARVDARENEAHFREGVQRVCEAIDAGLES
jgi:2-succinyl-5-enolpyruvyl-6-hydroxy-3-cyclohexene-1-carboxylate synthase